MHFIIKLDLPYTYLSQCTNKTNMSVLTIDTVIYHIIFWFDYNTMLVPRIATIFFSHFLNHKF